MREEKSFEYLKNEISERYHYLSSNIASFQAYGTGLIIYCKNKELAVTLKNELEKDLIFSNPNFGGVGVHIEETYYENLKQLLSGDDSYKAQLQTEKEERTFKNFF